MGYKHKIALSDECDQERTLIWQGLKETGCDATNFRKWAESQGYSCDLFFGMFVWTTRYGNLTVETVSTNNQLLIESCIYTPSDADDKRRAVRPRPDRIGDYIRMNDGSFLYTKEYKPPWPGAVILWAGGFPMHDEENGPRPFRLPALEAIYHKMRDLNLESTEERILFIAGYHGRCAPGEATPDMHLDDDLFDIDRFMLHFDLEDVFGVDFDSDEAYSWVYLKDVIEHVKVLLEEKEYTEEQIFDKLYEADILLRRGETVDMVSKKIGVSVPLYYRLRKDYWVDES